MKSVTQCIAIRALVLTAIFGFGVVANAQHMGGDAVYDIEVEGISYRVHVFTNAGTANFDVTAGGEVEILVVGGGGGGGRDRGAGGGGGAGGVIVSNMQVQAGSNYTVVVGSGGHGAAPGTNGEDSQIFGLVAGGGGRGGIRSAGLDGGSGGGGGSGENFWHGAESDGGKGTPGQGHDGGKGYHTKDFSKYGRGGGGGGAGGPGIDYDVETAGGPGGGGILSTITGEEAYYGGGGGGGSRTGIGGDGGIGGGGAGGSGNNSPGQDAQPNTGGGGGGTGNREGVTGGDGGSGIVIVRYLALVSLSSGTDQTVAWTEAELELATLTIETKNPHGTMTNGDTIRLSVPTDWHPRFDTGVTVTYGGDASGKVAPATFSSDGRTLQIPVTRDFVAGDTLTVSGLKLVDLALLAHGDPRRLELDYTGDGARDVYDDYQITITVVWPGGAYDGFDHAATIKGDTVR